MDYFLTFRGYGTWLHYDERGAVDALHNQPGELLLEPNGRLEHAVRRRMRGEPVSFDAAQRACIEDTMREVAAHRNWFIHALAVQTNHVHIVVSAGATPEKVMSDVKAYTTRRLREAQLVPRDAPIWSSHGSTKYLKTAVSLAAACRYVVESQADLSDCP